jgi:hypothetical protein
MHNRSTGVAATVTADMEQYALRDDAVALDALDPGTTLLVTTRNSEYRLVLLRERLALAEGGELFPVPTIVRLEGATAGGSGLRAGWIVVGLRMEMRLGLLRVRSSSVRSILIESGPRGPGVDDPCCA